MQRDIAASAPLTSTESRRLPGDKLAGQAQANTLADFNGVPAIAGR